MRLVGVDRDPEALRRATQAIAAAEDELPKGTEVELVHGNFSEIPALLAARGVRAHAVILDLGVSSMQLDQESRGFSFRGDGPLDMRMNPADEISARDLLNNASVSTLGDIILRYGEEKNWRKIVERIASERAKKPFETTQDLLTALGPVLDWKNRARHPATRLFQALRIAVNNEMHHLGEFMRDSADCVAEGGTLAVIAFHGLEEGIVKRAMRRDKRWRKGQRKAIVPTKEEVEANPRARSARLHIAERVSSDGAS